MHSSCYFERPQLKLNTFLQYKLIELWTTSLLCECSQLLLSEWTVICNALSSCAVCEQRWGKGKDNIFPVGAWKWLFGGGAMSWWDVSKVFPKARNLHMPEKNLSPVFPGLEFKQAIQSFIHSIIRLEGQHSVYLLFLGNIRTLIFTSWQCRNFVLHSSWTGKTLQDSLFVIASHSMFFPLLYLQLLNRETAGFVTEQAAVQINNTRTLNN